MRGMFAVLLGLLVVGASVLTAQYGYFGQNKIQYRRFDWRVLRGEHVDLYYYPEEEELGRVALAYAEESYRVLERRFNHAVTRRIPLIVYASHSDFEQTNILPFIPPEGLLGVTEFLKRRVALPFRGSYAEFRHTIRHELVHVFQLSLTTQTFSRYPRFRQVGMPLWWTEGLAEFFSAGEDSRDEMVLRDMTIAGHLPSLPDLAYAYGGLVYPVGGSIHHFLAEHYGEWRILELYNDIWKYSGFEAALLGVYGRNIEQLSDEWQYWMRQHYYPAVASEPPLSITARKLTELAIKPTAYQLPGDSVPSFLFFSPASGYTTIYAENLDGRGRRAVVQGERSEQFESFHFFESRIDVSTNGVATFSSKYAERDALFFWDLKQSKVVGRYQFPELVSILSPAWAPDGKSVVFSGLSVSGYSDIYRLWLTDSGGVDSHRPGRLERLTSDRYEDLDPTVSPDGRTVVFSSDRTPFGGTGARNLFTLDLATGSIRYLTYGNWRDEAPRWGGGRIYFASDRDGTFQVYSIDTAGTGRRETRTLNGVFDPQWVPGAHGGLLFSGFADLSFNIYVAPPLHDAPSTFALAAADSLPTPSWTWGELSHPQYARADGMPYERKFTLDFAAGDAAVAPGLGSAQGAVFVFSDLLSDHQLYLSLSSFQSAGFGTVFDNVSGSAFYLNQSRRVNWGIGTFRQRGLFYEGDFNTLFEERSYGAFAQVRYPFNRFRRIVGEYRLERSDRLDLTTNGIDEPHRVGWLASNYLTYVKDNTLWLPTGPIDGERYNLTTGLVNDLSHGRFDSWLMSADIRKYFRTSMHSALAFRVQAYTSGGERPRHISIGGSWGLRGYPQYGYVAGTRAWLVNAEYRFPILDFLTIGFPFGAARFPGVQGALFLDYGRAWSATTPNRGVLGASGLGLRMPVGPPLVLRLDLGYRLGTTDLDPYGLPASTRNRRFVDFFFGFNY
jgi:peptidase MA superfamily protein/WD40 repeat protein